MASDIKPAPAIAYGGASPYKGDASPRTLGQGDFSSVVPGGMDWIGEERKCVSTTKAGRACTARPLDYEDRCIGHKRQQEAAERLAAFES